MQTAYAPDALENLCMRNAYIAADPARAMPLAHYCMIPRTRCRYPARARNRQSAFHPLKRRSG